MKGYAVLALHCALLISVQCHQHTKRSADGPVHDGLNSILGEAHEHAALIANDLTQRMNQTFNSIKTQVDQLKENSLFTQKIEYLKSNGEVVQNCLKKNEVSIAQFMRKLVNTYDSCSKEVKDEVTTLVDAIKEDIAVIKTATQLIMEIESECFTEEMDLAASTLCVVTRIAEVQERIFEASQSLEQFISHSTDEVIAYSSNRCEGMTDLKKDFDSLYVEIESCVKDNK